MAMTVLNNSAALMTLGELNKNITKVGKSLSKVSTGQKIVYAGDNASDYGISEQMRAKIRSLEQDVKNVQNGSSLLKTALGGIQSIVDELRELKELAIDAANDSNTDADRATMQKVLKQKQANIDNVAMSTTFNTKSMLDGTYKNPHWEEKYFMKYDSQDTDGSIFQVTLKDGEKIKYITLENGEEIDGRNSKSGRTTNNKSINVIETMNTVKGLASSFEAMPNSVDFADGTRSVETKDTALYSLKPQNIRAESTGYITPNRNFIRSTGGAPIAIKMDFSGARITTPDGGDEGPIFDNTGRAHYDTISQLHNQGFTLLFSDSSRAVTIRFTTNSGDVDEGQTVNFDFVNKFQSNTGGDGENVDDDEANSGDLEYTIYLGSLNVEGGVTEEEFTKFIFDSLANCEDRDRYVNTHDNKYDLRDGAGCTVYGDVIDSKNPTITVGESTTTNYNSFVLSQKHNLRMAKGEDGNYYITAEQRYSHSLSILDDGFLGRSAPESKNDKEHEWWKFKINSFDSESGRYTVDAVREKYEYKAFDGNPLWIQHGTKAGQHTNIFINDMRTSALVIDVADVTTKDRAVATIDYVDVAIEYALNEATNVGAYLQRMEYTEANVTSEGENVQSAESTFRDADMAKEMTEYTKNNVLSQAAQSMLAQANQNLSGVLSLLQ